MEISKLALKETSGSIEKQSSQICQQGLLINSKLFLLKAVKLPVQGLYIFSSLLLCLLASSKSAIAQSIQTDGTTPTQLGNCSGDCLIEGGLQQGNNLFHSFEKFNVDQGATVLFQDPGVTNILSRVTGNEISQILGTLGISGGDANLFLLNPNGIIFGQDASLDLNGSFLATTSDGIRFGEEGLLDTAPNEIPLLTINPSALSFANGNQGVIRNESIAPAGADLSGIEDTAFGLRVPDGKSFLLVGGDVIFNGGGINAFGGQVELGGLREQGEIQLNFSDIDTGNISLSFPDQIQRADVSLTNEALINVPANGGGDITINAENITIAEGTTLRAGFGRDLGTVDSQAGDITLDAIDKLEIINGSKVINQVLEGATGSGGDLNINSGSLSVSNESTIRAISFSMGDAGDIKINVPNGLVEINNKSSVLTLIESISTDDLESIAIGDGGDIEIFAQNMSIENDSVVDASTLGQGNAGNIDISVAEGLKIAANSKILSVINQGAIGKGGNIDLEANSISLENDSSIDVSTLGEGNAGNIDISVAEGLKIAANSEILSVVNPGAIGDGGNISIEANSISLDSGSQLATSVFGRGKAGDIALDVVDSVNISGFGTEGLSSGIVAAIEKGGSGQAGNIIVNTNSFRIADGGVVSSQTFEESDGGNIFINAITFEAIGGGQIVTSADASGNAGNIKIQVSDELLLSGSDPNFAKRLAESNQKELFIGEAPGNSGFFANVRPEASGMGGDIQVTTGQLDIEQGAEINVSAVGLAEAGSISISAQNVTLDRGSLTAETRVGDQGNITLENANTLLLRNNSQITTNATESATGGNISITSDAISLLDNSDITANAVEGQGGSIQITTQGIFQEPDSQITATSELGIDGTITINSPDVDPTSGIFELPDVPIDAARILAQDLCKLTNDKIAKGSSFIITGRGGLTPTAESSLVNRDRIVNWASRDDLEVSNNGTVVIRHREIKDIPDKSYGDLQQSQGLVVAADGSTWLTANLPNVVPQNATTEHPDCQSSQK